MVIEQAEPDDFEAGRVLLEGELGAFFNQIGSGICISAQNKDGVIGASFTPTESGRSEKFIENTFLQIEPEEILLLGGVAVDKSQRGRGVGRELLLAQERGAAERGYRYIAAESWLESPSPSAPLLRKIGMREAARFPGYWKKSRPIPGYCGRCGDICLCTAILFYKFLPR